METTDKENNSNKTTVQVGANLAPELFAVLERLRLEEERPMSNMISVLLKTHPRIQPELESVKVVR